MLKTSAADLIQEQRDRDEGPKLFKTLLWPKVRLLTEAVSCHDAQTHDLLVERVCLTCVLVTSSFSHGGAEAERRLCSLSSAVSETKWHSCATVLVQHRNMQNN